MRNTTIDVLQTFEPVRRIMASDSSSSSDSNNNNKRSDKNSEAKDKDKKKDKGSNDKDKDKDKKKKKDKDKEKQSNKNNVSHHTSSGDRSSNNNVKALAPPSGQSNRDFAADHAGIIVGIAVGVTVMLLILTMIIICCCCCKKKKKKQHYYMNTMPGGGGPYPNGGPYSGPNGPGQPWYNSEMNTQQQHNSTGGWGAMPPPPPPYNMSGEMSGQQYSSGQMSNASSTGQSPSLGFNKSTFSYEELSQATQGFSQENLLGQGGFGFVHKGILPNGKEVAVKSLKSGSGQGEREFQAEVEIISRVHHRHLVSLVGYCIAGGQRMLVYEFVDNGTLEFHLHGSGRPVIDFPTRLKIAIGSAKGLAYLHEDCHPRIIHRDIKAANILLDMSCEAKVADFGLARLNNDTNTHVSTRVMGTFGYLAPEYAASGKLTEKSDVFSFGVMLLELITGRPPIDFQADEDDCLVDWARPRLTKALDQGIYDGLVDPSLLNEYDPREMKRMVACGAASIRHSGKRRPKMSQIVRALEGDGSLEYLNEGVKPGQSAYFGPGGGEDSDYDAATYREDMERLRRQALDSSDYSSSDYGTTGNHAS